MDEKLFEDKTLFEKIKEYVRMEQEKRGKEDPVSFHEIASVFGCREEALFLYFAHRIDDSELVGLDLFITFNE